MHGAGSFVQLLVKIGQVVLEKNKRPMGHIAHLRKQFKSINTYDYIIMLIKRRKKKHYKLYNNLLFFSFEET